MMKTNQYFHQQFAQYDDNDSRYRDANQVLYRMVQEWPENTDPNKVVAKFWIIGRTYAAVVERRSNKATTPGDFYYDYVAPRICESELDAKIAAVKAKNYEEVSEESIRDILDLHGYLVGILKGLTGKDKRSLASKYLHFHLPDLVFIYDSRVSKVIGEFVDGKVKVPNKDPNWDEVYAKFVYKVFEIYKTLRREDYHSENGDTLPRVIDTFLLRYCDSKNVDGTEE